MGGNVKPMLQMGLPDKFVTASRQEIEHARFEHPVADRQHVVAARNIERPPVRDQRRASSCAEPATSSLVPTATSTGTSIAAHLSRDSVCREPRMQAASAFRSDLVCSAKARNVRPNGSRTSASDGASSASAIDAGSADAVDQADAQSAEDRAAHPLRMRERQERGDAGAHRIAHDVGARDIQMIEQRAHVLRHDGAVIGGRIVELGSMRRARDCRAR